MQGPIFISQYRAGAASLLSALEVLQNLRAQYDALDLGNTLTNADFSQGHSDIIKADLVAAVGSVGAFTALLGEGHGTNLYKMKP